MHSRLVIASFRMTHFHGPQTLYPNSAGEFPGSRRDSTGAWRRHGEDHEVKVLRLGRRGTRVLGF
jgi:hypothetical protein